MSTTEREFVSLNAAVLTVSDTRTRANDTSGDLIEKSLQQAGHNVVARGIQREDLSQLRARIQELVNTADNDVLICTGGTGLTLRDVTPEAVSELFDKHIPGFGELFRMLSYDEIGASTIESRADAGVANGTLVFILPGSPGACRLAMDSIILKQLDARTRPCNLVALLPRIRAETAP